MNFLALFGHFSSYRRCPDSPSGMGDRKARSKIRGTLLWCGCALLGTLLLVFLGLYVSEHFSGSANRWRDCEQALSNQTSQMQEQVRLFRADMKAMEINQEKSRRENNRLTAQLEATNNSLAEAKGHWDACLDQAEFLKHNFTSQMVDAEQEREVRKATEEKVKQLQAELQTKSQDLDNMQRQLQQEREQYEAKIQVLKADRHTQQPNFSNQGVVGVPSATFLLFAFAIFLVFFHQ